MWTCVMLVNDSQNHTKPTEYKQNASIVNGYIQYLLWSNKYGTSESNDAVASI